MLDVAEDRTTIDGYVRLFRGRADAYGGWSGRCVRSPVTPNTFRGHLNNGDMFGVYPAFNITFDGVTEPHCVWGCTDIDYTDDPSDAVLIRTVFAQVGVTAWVERTAHGYHTWVFFDQLVRAIDVRNMFLAAHQVANIPPKEVNPKQTVLAVGQVGNYVRLPYPHYHTEGITNRYFIDSSNATMALERFVQEAVDAINPAAKAAQVAAYYIAPPQPVLVVAAPTQDMEQAARQLTALGKVIWRDGPLEGGDRSSKLQHLAYECTKAGLAPSDALLLVKDADQRWGKYSTRGEAGQMELQRLVTRAYGSTPFS